MTEAVIGSLGMLEEEVGTTPDGWKITDYNCRFLSGDECDALFELKCLAKKTNRGSEFLDELVSCSCPYEVQQLYLKHEKEMKEFSRAMRIGGFGKKSTLLDKAFFDNLELLLRVEGQVDWMRRHDYFARDLEPAYHLDGRVKEGWIRLYWK